jgi:alpha-1,3-rhamnosyltransferase
MDQKSEPLVSVVIPCYNHEKYVQDTIKSVLNQSYRNIELIIIDDGSKDSSVEKIQQMLEECKNRFSRFEFRSRPNKGLSATLNEAIEWSRGKYFSAIASDDLMLENKTSTQVKVLEENDQVVALFGSVNYINENNIVQNIHTLDEKEYPFDKIILNECQFYAPTQMLKMATLRKIGGYNEEIRVEDWYMWLKMAEKGKVLCITDKLAIYRIHSANTTRNSKFIFEENLKTLNLYKEHKLYNQAYHKLRWTYIIWSGQKDKIGSLFMLLRFILSRPEQIFSRNFLVYCKYFFVKIKSWY